MGRAHAALVLAAALVATVAPVRAEDAPPFDLAKALAEAVDLPTPERRRAAADVLAARESVTLEAVLEAALTFGSFAEIEAGVHADTVTLNVLGKDEATPLHTYVPESYDCTKPSPLLMVFHGAGGRGDGQHGMWVETAEALGMIVVAPSEVVEHGGYNFTRRERANQMAAIRWARRRFDIDENRVSLAGISRGGHLSWDLALRFPDRFAAIAPMVGGPRWELRGGQNNMRYLENVAHLPIRDLQGWKDQKGMLFNLEIAFQKLTAFGAADAQLIKFPDLGHSFDFGAVDWPEFLGKAKRDPRPERVVRSFARKGEARAAWLEVVKFDGKKVKEVFQPRIDQKKWMRMGRDDQRRFMASAGDQRTGRVEARMTAPGRFDVKAKGAKRVRLLLTPDMLDPEGPVVVRWNGRPKKKTATRSKQVLLREFVERFDRTFLPVAAVTVP